MKNSLSLHKNSSPLHYKVSRTKRSKIYSSYVSAGKTCIAVVFFSRAREAPLKLSCGAKRSQKCFACFGAPCLHTPPALSERKCLLHRLAAERNDLSIYRAIIFLSFLERPYSAWKEQVPFVRSDQLVAWRSALTQRQPLVPWTTTFL